MKPSIYNLQAPPTEAEIKETEDTLGCKLPEEYIAFLRHQNGGICIPARLWLAPRHIEKISLRFLYSIGNRPWGEQSVLLATRLFRQDERVVGYIPCPDDYVLIGRDDGGTEFLLGIAKYNFNQVSYWQPGGEGIKQLFDGNQPCTFAKLMDSFCYKAGAINDPFIHRCTADELRVLIESGRIPLYDLYGNSLRYRAEAYERKDLLDLFDEMGL